MAEEEACVVAGMASLECIDWAGIASYELLPVHWKTCDIMGSRQPVHNGGNVTPRIMENGGTDIYTGAPALFRCPETHWCIPASHWNASMMTWRALQLHWEIFPVKELIFWVEKNRVEGSQICTCTKTCSSCVTSEFSLVVMQPDSGFFCEGNSSDDDVVLKEEFRGIVVKQGCLLKQVSIAHVPSCHWGDVAWIQDYSFTPKSFTEERN